MKSRPKTPKLTDAPAARLAALLKSNEFIPFELDIPDKEFPYVRLSIFGDKRTNELFVRLTNGKSTFVEVVASPLIVPGMADRIFGMDASDAQVAFALADKMWEKHKTTLMRR